MAAPVNLPSHAAQPNPQPQSKPVAQSPASPRTQARERERITLLLDINRELLQEILRLQDQGKGGLVNQPPPPPDAAKDADANKPASKEYIDCMRRLQANLSYLATTAERSHVPNKPVPPGPAIMAVPSVPPALADMYGRLQDLFPGWKGQQLKPANVSGQSPQRPPMQQSPQAQPQG